MAIFKVFTSRGEHFNDLVAADGNFDAVTDALIARYGKLALQCDRAVLSQCPRLRATDCGLSFTLERPGQATIFLQWVE